MTGPSLARLYPAAWRARYGAEFEALLAARPLTARDRFDIVRGALDARLHPQVPGEPYEPRVANRTDRVNQGLLVAGGILLSIWAGVLILIQPRWGSGFDPEPWLSTTFFVIGLLGSCFAIAGLLTTAHRHGNAVAEVGFLGALLASIGLLFSTFGGGVAGLLMLAAGSIIFGSRAAGRICAWPVAIAFVAGTALLAVGLLGFVSSGGQDTRFFWLTAAFGPAWIVLGLGLRPAPAEHRPVSRGDSLDLVGPSLSS